MTRAPGASLWRSALFFGVLVYLAAWALRLAVVTDHSLHPDETLYGYWGSLILSGRDPWLVTTPVYKPPLLPYLTAGSLAWLGCDRAAQPACAGLAVRMPGLAAGMLTVGVTGQFARRLYRDCRAGLAAALVVALSPFALLFSATGFTDPLMVAAGIAGCWAAAAGRPGWAGLLAGLAAAFKQSGVAWAPLIGLLVLVTEVRRGGLRLLPVARGVLGFLAVLGLVVLWDQVRVVQGAQGFWQTGVLGYGGLRTIWPGEWSARLWAWGEWLRYLPGSLPLDLLLVGGAALLVVRGLRRRDWRALYDLALVLFCLLYLGVHWLWAFPTWDRYLLPLALLAGVLLGRIASRLVRRVSAVPRRGLWVEVGCWALLVIGLAVPAARAVGGAVPVGAGLAAYDGMERLAGFLWQLPEGAVLYHHWLGWQYSFYLFDGPLYLAYWPTPAWLAQDVRVFGPAGPRYIAFPAWESPARVERELAAVGYRLELVLTVEGREGKPRFRLFRLCQMTNVQPDACAG
ncbi:MAG: hypothetical protein JW900_13950 [Anaerolineae bacterium]|nr:hypothetical protein [Anaerolineae bacterium]